MPSPNGWFAAWIASNGEDEMVLLGGIIVLGLLVYLMAALLKPEWF